MKNTSLIVLSLFLTLACQEEEIFREIPLQEDLAHLEGMQSAFDLAEIYNDSVGYFVSVNPNQVMANHYDQLFHFQDSIFDVHHLAYSHLNAYDDHHHEANPPAHRHHEDRIMDQTFFDDHGDSGQDADDGHGHGDEDLGHDETEGDHEEEEGDHEEEDDEHRPDLSPIQEMYTHTLGHYEKMMELRDRHGDYH